MSTKSRFVTEGEVPLYLLPHTIARQIYRACDSAYCISAKRTHWQDYNISVRTKSLPKKIAPERVAGWVEPVNSLKELRHNTGELDFERTAYAGGPRHTIYWLNRSTLHVRVGQSRLSGLARKTYIILRSYQRYR
ncbi:MAG: hypothetical protein WCF90_01295 [Methanomicrobiales archaeon]